MRCTSVLLQAVRSANKNPLTVKACIWTRGHADGTFFAFLCYMCFFFLPWRAKLGVQRFAGRRISIECAVC